MTDDQVLDVIAVRLGAIDYTDDDRQQATQLLAALRDAGLTVGPDDTFKLGKAVESNIAPGGVDDYDYYTTANQRTGWRRCITAIYAEAGVERP